jgi:DNA-binding GntR family transcriptional regulator
MAAFIQPPFQYAPGHQEIAEMVGSTRETVTRTLAQFRQNGWIRTQGVSVEILQQEKMRNISI